MNKANLNSLPVISAAVGTGTAAIIVFALMPILVGAMADRYSLDDLQSGLIATAYFSTYALVALASPLWVRRWNWRLMSFLGYAIMLISLAVVFSAESYSTARWAIAFSGMGAGLLYPVSLTLVSDMANPERVYSLALAVEQLVPAGVLLSLGVFFAGGLEGALSAMMAVLVLCLVASVAMPSAGRTGSDTASGDGSFLLGVLALAALAISFAGVCGRWVFLERIGVENGFDAEFTNLWLAVGLITSGVGPLLAAVVADRLGWIVPVVCGSLLALLAMGLLAGDVSQLVFATVLTLLPLGYYFAVSYFMSIVAAADANGKMAGLMSFALAIGSAVGPALFGAMRNEGGPVLALMAALIVAGSTLIIYVAIKLKAGQAEVAL
jgi:predicted MFS family arabinose efflux permease